MEVKSFVQGRQAINDILYFKRDRYHVEGIYFFLCFAVS